MPALQRERFIHDDLRDYAAKLAENAREEWRKTQHVTPLAITWPREQVKADDGSVVEHAVLCRLPPDEEGLEYRRGILRKMVERTKAYGLVLVERRLNTIRVLFETQHGARAWLMPLERHGDVYVPGATQVEDDATCVGILWGTN
jgi:hypothetical protein